MGEIKMIMLPADEIKDIFLSFSKEVIRVGIMTGDETGLFCEYYDHESDIRKMQIIRPIPAK
jgi:hypothetical protein